MINVNESIVTLLLKLHSKYSGRPDSYVPKRDRTGVSVSSDYANSRIGDGSFFIEKVLDKICEIDASCLEAVVNCRKELWPDYHEEEAKRDAEREKQEAEAKKRRAKERQRQMMEQLAQQRQRFASKMSTNPASTDEPEVKDTPTEGTSNPGGKNKKEAKAKGGSKAGSVESDDGAGATVKAKEYTCCHCLTQTSATEAKPIGLVTLIQSTSVLAHKHESTNHLVLPTSEEEEASLPHALEDSLGLQHDELFENLNKTYDSQSCLLSLHRGWKGGIHIQSCGHHMHYDCRSNYCDALRNQLRGPRDVILDFDRGEFICPMCRQVANALLPVPPDAPPYPVRATDRLDNQAATILGILGKEAALMVSHGKIF